MTAVKCLVIGASFAMAGAAQAQFSYDLHGFSTQLFSFDTIRYTGAPNAGDSWEPADNTGPGIYQSAPQTFQRSFTLDNTLYPQILSAHDHMSVTTQASPTRFSFAWDAAQSGSLASPATDVTRFRETALSAFNIIRITMTQAAPVRITWHAQASGILGGGTDVTLDQPNNFSNGSLSGTAVPTAFSFGYGSGPLDVQNDFSFDINALSGQIIDLNLRTALSIRNEAFPNMPSSWNQASSGYFTVEVIPAPSAAALLAGGLLLGARRRRSN